VLLLLRILVDIETNLIPQFMHTKHFILTGVLALIALALILVGTYQFLPTEQKIGKDEVGNRVEREDQFGGQPIERPSDGVSTDRRGMPGEKSDVPTGKIQADVFTGTLKAVDIGCFVDGECFVDVDGKHVTAIMGWSQEVVGTVQGVEGFGDLESHIGEKVEVYAQVKEDGTYTLYGSEGFYIKLMNGNEMVNPVREPITTGGCSVGGCSGQICADAATAGDMATTCEYRAEYACYKEAMCERQATGKCGWTDTSELRACIQNAGFETM
jgi:hypothetical protein